VVILYPLLSNGAYNALESDTFSRGSLGEHPQILQSGIYSSKKVGYRYSIPVIVSSDTLLGCDRWLRTPPYEINDRIYAAEG
jgi:hypothetical protein